MQDACDTWSVWSGDRGKVVRDEQGALKVAGFAAKRTGSTVYAVLPFFMPFLNIIKSAGRKL
ncbi:hypothetical protein TUM12370_08150 [Salmonella enterica subsp. enterica serovar Choleraesuis]|nr:hypothetical protein TUM12370_08150 [Salmonella enterica subsp. enterica serovar Choleraesuis]